MSDLTPGTPAVPPADLEGTTPRVTPDTGTDDPGRQPDTGGADPTPGGGGDLGGGGGGDTFPRAYVEKLRKSEAGYRERAARADALEQENTALAQRLHESLVRADGRLADPADLPYHPDHLDDPAALTEAITALVRTRPGLKARSAAGDVGAGSRGPAAGGQLSLIDHIKGLG